MKIAIAGATGLVGTELCKQLRSHEVIVMSRSPEKASRTLGVKAISSSPSATELEGVDAVVNLAGESIAEKRWNQDIKKRIRESRVDRTRELVKTMNSMKRPPKVFVSASAVGFYGDRGDETLVEKSSPGSDFLAGVCKDWESEASKFTGRTAIIRIGIVLSPNGGALKKMLTPFRLGAGGTLGDGKQWMSWIHIRDLVNLVIYAIENESVKGPVNAAAPNPVNNKEFTATLAKVLNKPAILPAPKFALKLALGEMAAVVLGSQKAEPASILKAGFKFEFQNIETALRDLI